MGNQPICNSDTVRLLYMQNVLSANIIVQKKLNEYSMIIKRSEAICS